MFHLLFRFTVTHSTDFQAEKKNYEQKKSGCFCEICGKKYLYEKARDNHEIQSHNFKRSQDMPPPVPPQTPEDTDFVKSYSKALLTFNLFLRNINDCIREGDGERLMNCYRFALVYFRCFGHPKYAYTVLKMFHRIKLEPQNAFRLIWGRFINTVGLKGRNISRDLHLEHVNNQLKELLRSLRSNLNESNAKRVANSLKNLTDIINNLEKFSNVEKTSSNKRFRNLSDVKKLAVQYHEKQIFEEIPGRKHDSFSEFNEDVLRKLDIKATFKWLKEKKKEFIDLYST